MKPQLSDAATRPVESRREDASRVLRMLDRLCMPRMICERRTALRSHFDVAGQFSELEESCIPSYVHRNSLAAWVSWSRLLEAARLYERWCNAGAVLDFGSATGEIAHLVAPPGEYCFIEQQDIVADALLHWLPNARRIHIDDLGRERFAVIFALDSLEHNKDTETLVAQLETGLHDSGVFILSGPTENLLYRTGRKLAGFDGGYHHQTIWQIEKHVRSRMSLLERSIVPLGFHCFRCRHGA